MADPRGFLKFKREAFAYRPVSERVLDYHEIEVIHPEDKSKEQAARCMDCGTPFCNWGCPTGNYIPDWNDQIYQGRWEDAFFLLNDTANMPEVTGRICPAPCEYACVLGINDTPVTIRDNELAIIERAWKDGTIQPRPPLKRTGKKAAVIGSGPAGLAAAAQLNQFGHSVTVFEKSEVIGGIMRLGIPDFKLEKKVLDRRIDLWKKEGIQFKTSINAGVDIPAEKLLKEFDAVCLATGCGVARDLDIPGRSMRGIHQAMDYLIQSNQRVAGKIFQPEELIDARDKNVVVIGGGDTGSDCVGTANRQGAKSVTQIEILPEPPVERPAIQPWPLYPIVYKTTSSHEEGVNRKWSILTKEFIGEGTVKHINCVQVRFEKIEGQPRPVLKEIPGTELNLEADLVILAMGFTNPLKEGLLTDLGVQLDSRGNVIRELSSGATSVKGVYSAGDISRGPSLIVWCLAEGRRAAAGMDRYLR